MKIVRWLLTLKEGKQLLATLMIAILFLTGGWGNEKRSFSEYRTDTENKRIDTEIKHNEKEARQYEWIIQVQMQNNQELMKLMERIDSLSKIITQIPKHEE